MHFCTMMDSYFIRLSGFILAYISLFKVARRRLSREMVGAIAVPVAIAVGRETYLPVVGMGEFVVFVHKETIEMHKVAEMPVMAGIN
jgi:hypothetical protein